MIKTLNQHGFYQKDIAAKLEIHPKNRQSVSEARKPAEGMAGTLEAANWIRTNRRSPACQRPARV